MSYYIRRDDAYLTIYKLILMDCKVFFKIIIIKTFYHLYCNDEKIQIYKFFLWNKYYEIKLFINS